MRGTKKNKKFDREAKKIISSSIPAGPSLWCFVILQDLPPERVGRWKRKKKKKKKRAKLPIKKVSDIQRSVSTLAAV